TELVDYVLPKTQRTDGFVNDKRMVKQPGDIKNPVGSSHRNDQFSRGKETYSDKSKGSSKTEIVPRKGAPPSSRNESERQSLYTPGKRSYETQPRGNPYANRDQQFSRPSDGKSRDNNSYESPYSRRKEPIAREEEFGAPWQRGSRPSGSDNSKESSREVSPRYSDEAKKLFQLFEERKGSSRESSRSSSPQYRAPEPRQNRAEPPKRQENRGREKQSSPKSGNQKPNKH
ncbi:MAG TPA: hypothetical protein VJ521_00095, partial [Acidobacteriota bacterium]|nr:hypothetical protein [Acidobacteriota bacterium]